MYKDDNHFVESMKVRTRVQSVAHEIFLDESISSPEYYRNVISTLRNQVGEGDIVEMYISNGGGLAHTASTIIDAMRSCQGRIIAYLSGEVCSAATTIALNAHDWNVGDNLLFMIHTCSFGTYGDSVKVKDHHDFVQQWNDNLFKTTYEGFLTEEEINASLEYGKEWWFGSEEVVKRLENFVKHHQEKSEQKLNAQMEAQFEEEDAFVEKGISMLEKNGDVNKEEIAMFKRISDKLNKLFETGEIFQDNIPCTNKSCSECDTGSEDVPLASFFFEKEISPQDTFEEDTCGNMLPVKDVFGETWELTFDLDDEGDIESLELEYTGLEQDYYIISKLALEDTDKDELKSLAERFEISFPHNIGKQTLIKKIVDHFECEVLDCLI
jgi:ATP-dependent protease ClpP protease subunit